MILRFVSLQSANHVYVQSDEVLRTGKESEEHRLLRYSQADERSPSLVQSSYRKILSDEQSWFRRGGYWNTQQDYEGSGPEMTRHLRHTLYL